MIAFTDILEFDTSFHCRLDLDNLLCEYGCEVDPLTDKFKYIQYWKRIIKVIHHYKNKLQTFAYVIIRPIVHIRTLHTVY